MPKSCIFFAHSYLYIKCIIKSLIMLLFLDIGYVSHVAGIIAGTGATSDGKYRGIAPKANLIILKVLDHRGNGSIPDVLKGIEWIIQNKEKYNIRITNISVGSNKKEENDNNSKLVEGVNKLWDAGIVVCVAAGNNGPAPQSITTPGTSRKVITVGASDDSGVVEVMGNMTSDYSGRGPTKECICKPDVVAPGSNIFSCRAINKGIFQSSKVMYEKKSGTSMSTPIVSGCAALIISANPKLTNNDVKMILINGTEDLGLDKSRQGNGLVRVDKILKSPYVTGEF